MKTGFPGVAPQAQAVLSSICSPHLLASSGSPQGNGAGGKQPGSPFPKEVRVAGAGLSLWGSLSCTPALEAPLWIQGHPSPVLGRKIH